MRRTILSLSIAMAAPLTFAPLSASAGQGAATPATPPSGWTIRLDSKDTAQKEADTHFVTMGQGFHVTSGPAAIYYGMKDQATGSYTVRASFGQRTKPAMGHPEAYGVFVGGSMLNDYSQQQYLYLAVRDDGMFFVAHRAGGDVHKIVDWTANDAVKKANEAGSVSNDVAIRVTPDSVTMLVNGAAVKAFAKGDMKGFNTDGQYGLRVNHGLNVHISNFGVQK